MSKQLKMVLGAFLALFIAFPVLHAQAAEAPKLPNGEYDITVQVLKDTSDEVSATSRYINEDAKLVVEDGKNYAVVTITSSQWWKSFKTQAVQPGTFSDDNFEDTTTVSEDNEKNTRVVKFEVPDFTKPLNAKIHIVVTGVPGVGAYDNSYDIRLKFGRGGETGGENTENPDKGEDKEPAQPGEALKDGEYTVNFEVLHETEDKASSMGRYIAAPADLQVKDGKNTVVIKLTNNEQIKQFQVEKDGEFVDSTVVATDEEANTRTVSFEVADLGKIMNAKVQVFVEAQNYTGNHVVRLSFDADSVKKVGGEEELPVLFKDIEKSWAKKYIEALASKGLIKGLSNEEFGPDKTLTRAQFTAMIVRALDLPLAEYEGTFTDVTENSFGWAVLQIEAAKRAGIVAGYEEGFKPAQKINREQMVTMLVRAIDYANKELTEELNDSKVFADDDKIASYAKDNVYASVALGLIDGKEVNGKTVFDPKGDATRAQAAKVIFLFAELLK